MKLKQISIFIIILLIIIIGYVVYKHEINIRSSSLYNNIAVYELNKNNIEEAKIFLDKSIKNNIFNKNAKNLKENLKK